MRLSGGTAARAGSTRQVRTIPGTIRPHVERPIVSLEGITRRWRRSPSPVLDRVDLSLSAGEAVWIGGRNGAGKTTLLRIIAGLLDPNEGAVSVLGLHPRHDRRDYQRQLGFLSAGNTALYARLTIRQHLDYWSKITLIPRAQRTDRIERALERFDLRELASRRVDRMSMGQRQRVRLAMTFLQEPKLLLLDEPRNSLDDEGVAILTEAVAHTRRAGGAAIWCSPSGDRRGIPFDRLYLVQNGALTPA